MIKKTNIQIVQPPLQELNKKGSCIKHTFVSGCGCIVFFICITLLFLRFFVLSYPQKIYPLPTSVTEQFSLYNQDSIDTIKIVSGKKRANMVNKVAFIPKILLSPILFGYQLYEDHTKEPASKVSKRNTWNNFVEALQTSIVDERDTIEVTWDNEQASPMFILDFYKNQFKRNGFVIQEIDSPQKSTVTFEKNIVSGSLYILKSKNSQETTNIILTISLPN